MLLDAVHNLPDLLLRWPDANESWIRADLEQVESRFEEWRGCFVSLLEDGPRPGWQLREGAPTER